MNNVIVITGQTATGKTGLAVRYAKEMNGELVNCDARQIYKHLDIVTGKDLTDTAFHQTAATAGGTTGYYLIDGVKIWLYDIVESDQYFSSHSYVSLASDVIRMILQAGKIPIVTGGSYFYLKHLLYGTLSTATAHDPDLRERLTTMGKEELKTYLRKVAPSDYETLNDSDRENPRRLIRRIEKALTHEKHEVFDSAHGFTLANRLGVGGLHTEVIGLRYESREALSSAITKRVDERLEKGAVEEIGALMGQGRTESDPGMKTIGCVQLYNYLRGTISLEGARSEWILRELQYAKRQYTFMKTDPHIKWRIIA